MKDKIKRSLWFVAGCLCLCIAYIGIITPGIPWSTPTVGAAFCFAKSSKRMHDWLMGHKLFGPFLRGWAEKRIFPTRGKWFMLLTMDLSLLIILVTTRNVWAVLGTAAVMGLVAWWAWRFPGSEEEWRARSLESKSKGD